MCWNIQISLLTWLISLISGIYLLKRQHKYDLTLGLLILTYSSMQLWEALIWLGQNCNYFNYIGTFLAYYALWFHVFAIGLGLYLEFHFFFPLILGLFYIMLAIILQPIFKCSLPDISNKHLVWGFNPKFYILIFITSIIFCLFYIKPLSKAIIISLLFILSFFYSYVYSKNTIGSYWCWLTALFAFIFIIIN